MNVDPHPDSTRKGVVSIYSHTEALYLSYALVAPSFRGMLQFMLFDHKVFDELRNGTTHPSDGPFKVTMSKRQLRTAHEGLQANLAQTSQEMGRYAVRNERTRAQMANELGQFLSPKS